MSATGASIRVAGQPDKALQAGRLLAAFRRVTGIALSIALLAGLGVLLYRGYVYFQSPVNFPVSTAKVNGSFQYLNRDAVQQRVMQHARKGFFGMDVERLHAEITAMPWVYTASVRRIWPDAVVLTITEHQPLARLNGNTLLTATGEVITPEQLAENTSNAAAWKAHFSTLPSLRSVASNPELIWHQYNQAGRALKAAGLALQGLQSDTRHAVSLQLANGIEVRLGRNHFGQRLNRFVGVYEQYIAPESDTVAYVDMRYPNGFAVGRRVLQEP